MKFETKVAIGVGVGAAVMAGIKFLSDSLTRAVMSEALDRNEPKSIKVIKSRLSGNQSRFDSDPYKEAMVCSEELKKLPHERVEITSDDGTKLVGHYFPCEKPERIIVAMHGWRSGWAYDFGKVSSFWFENNCAVLFAEQRGQGDSGGDYMGFGLIERYDCVDWVKYMNGRLPDGLPVYLAGISMGAATVLMASGLELPENVRGIMADCGYTSPKAIWKHVCEDNMHIPFGTRQELVDRLCRERITYGADEYSTVDALRHTKTPVLFVHGTADTFVPVEMTYENYMACASPKRLLIVPGAEHGLSYMVEPEKYKNEVKAFWADFDGERPADAPEAENTEINKTGENENEGI